LERPRPKSRQSPWRDPFTKRPRPKRAAGPPVSGVGLHAPLVSAPVGGAQTRGHGGTKPLQVSNDLQGVPLKKKLPRLSIAPTQCRTT
jgi:hypothetical protein